MSGLPFVYLGVKKCNLSGLEVAKALNMTRSGVSVAANRGEGIISSEPGSI
jgi:hypothetical protein